VMESNEMPVNKKVRDPNPENFETADELDEFWSTHSTADYPENFREVHFNIKLDDEPITLEPPLAAEIRKRASQRKMSVNEFVNRFLEEPLKQAA